MQSILAVLMGLFCVSGVTAQDKCKLDVRSQVGDKVTQTEKFFLEGSFTITMGEIKQEMEMFETKNEVSIDHVLSVDEDGWRSKVRRTVKTKGKREKNPGEPEEKETVSPLQGKTFVVIQDGEDSRRTQRVGPFGNGSSAAHLCKVSSERGCLCWSELGDSRKRIVRGLGEGSGGGWHENVLRIC